MRPNVAHLLQGPASLRPVLDHVTATDTTLLSPGQRPPRWRPVHVVHAHEGAAVAGRRLADDLGVPLVVTAQQALVPVEADLVVGTAEAPPPGSATRWRRIVPDRPGAVADLEALHLAVAAGRPLPTLEPLPMPPTVTVVMSTYDRAPLLRSALQALADQDLPADRWDLVVVDNGSTDATPEVLATARACFGTRLTVLRNPTNTSAAEARNRGIEHATGELVAFTDDDCRPTPTWLSTLVGSFRSDVGIVQGRTRPDPAAALGPTSRSQWTSREHGLYETCNIAYRRADLEALGPEPFPVDLPDTMRAILGPRVAAQAFGEDVDVAWRLKRRGVTSRFAPDAVVHHHVFSSDPGYLLRRSLLVAGFPVLVSRYPELRRQFLHHRVFLSRRHLWALVALLAASTRSPWTATIGAAPYAWELLRPTRPGRRRRIVGAPLRALRDTVETAALVYGSVRARSLVL